MPVRPAATASFESAPVFEGQPLRGFTSDVFVALPGSSGGENKRDELVSWCGPRSPLLGEQAALPGSPAAAQGSRQGRYPPLALLPSECGWGGPGAGAARAVTPGWSLSGCPCTRVPWGYRGASPLQGPRSAHFTHGPGHQQEGWGPERLPGGGAGQAEFGGVAPHLQAPHQEFSTISPNPHHRPQGCRGLRWRTWSLAELLRASSLRGHFRTVGQGGNVSQGKWHVSMCTEMS